MSHLPQFCNGNTGKTDGSGGNLTLVFMSIGRHSLHNYISSHEWYSCKQDIGLLTLFLAMTCWQLTREAHSSSSRAMLTVTRNEVEYLWSKSSVHSRRACPLAQGSPALLRVLITLERRPVLLLLQWLGLLGLWEILRDWKKGQVTATSKLMWPTHETIVWPIGKGWAFRLK